MNSEVLAVSFISSLYVLHFQIFYSDYIFYNKKLLRRKFTKICVEQGQKKDILIKYILKKRNKNRKNETIKILKVLPYS